MKRIYELLLGFLCCLMLITACSRKANQHEEIATVNDAPILLKDFQKEVALASQRDPTLKINRKSIENLLESMIKKRLMIQEAVKKGLSEDEHFRETIKTFWEQTLIRQLINAKTKEWPEILFVNEAEIKQHYERMRHKLTMRMVNVETAEGAEDIKREMLNGKKMAGEEIIGPFLIENIQLDSSLAGSLYHTFDLSIGEAKIFKMAEGYVIVQVIKKEAISVPPLAEIGNQIKAYLLEQKKQTAMTEWLNTVESSAQVNINTNLLNKVANER